MATFISVPILALFNWDWHMIVEMDTSNYISAGVFSQYNNNNILYPMAYFSKRYSSIECN
jgi:hypothetical protein